MTAEPLPVATPESTPAGYERRERGRGMLALVPPPVRARRAPFVALLIALLAGGLVGLLLLNTASAQDAFRLHTLQSQAAALERQKADYANQGDGLGDPARLAMRAAALGLVPGGTPIFLANGQPLPKGAIRLGNLAYVPAPVVIPPPLVTPSPATPATKASAPATKASKKPVAKASKKPVARTSKKPVGKATESPRDQDAGRQDAGRQDAGRQDAGRQGADHGNGDLAEGRHDDRYRQDHDDHHHPADHDWGTLMSPTAPPPLKPRPVSTRPVGTRGPARPASERAQGEWSRRARRRGYRLRPSGRRLRMAAALMAALFLLLAGRLVQLQGFKSHSYAAMAEQQRTRVVEQPAIRGEIKDRSGNVLAVDIDAADVYVQPPKVKDAVSAAKKLAPVLHVPESILLARMIDHSNFRYLAYDVDPAVGERVTKMKLEGVGTLPQRKRLYPAGALAGNVLGTVGRDGNGLAGLESAYNTGLAGKSGTLVVEEDPQGRTIPSGTHREKEPVAGQGLQLTLDRDIQYYAEQTLAAEVKASGAIKGVAIVMNPKTGDIYAMASAPGFNPNDPLTATPAQLQNPDVAWTFEPGSVNKLVTIATAINRGIVNPLSPVSIPLSSTYPPVGIKAGDYTIHDAEDHPAETLTVAGVLAESSNLGTLLISRMLPSSAALEQGLRSFGLGEPTGVGLPGESQGLLAKSSTWSVAQAANIPFGQSMSVNELQVASAYATVANGGVRVTPRIIDGIIDGKGKVEKKAAGPARRVVSAQTAKTMQQLLEQVTTTNGTGTEAAIPGYRVAGKTGTANRIDPQTGRYSGYVASFVGFAPADKPSLVVAVSLDNPTSSIFGGTVAAPVFKNIMQFALTSLRIPPTGTTPVVYPLKAG